MKEQFEVIEVNNKMMTLKANRSGGCSACSVNSVCGTGILTHHFDHSSVFNKPLKTGLLVGDFVTLEISSSTLFFRAFQLYIVPLLMLFFGTILGQTLFPASELWQIGFGLLSFSMSFLLVKYFAR